MTRKKKNSRPSAPLQPQSFRVVSSSGSSTTSPTVEIRAVLDSKRGSNYILWEDIQQQFGTVQYVMMDGVMIPFMRDANYSDVLPLRIETHQGATLEVVLQESEQDIDDGASIMPDLELLSIADPDPNHGLDKIHPGGPSNAQNRPKNAQDVNELKAMFSLTRLMKGYDQKTAEDADILKDETLDILSTLAFSDSLEMQQLVAQSYHMISYKVDGPVSKIALKPLVHLLQSNDLEVQEATTTATFLLSVNVENKSKIVELGAIEPLIRLMLSPDIAVYLNALACICSLSQKAEVAYTPEIVKLGALAPLVRLIQSENIDVQNNAAGALNNISDCEELVEDVVKSGAVPFLIRLLGPGTPQNIQQQCAEALCNISYNEIEKERLFTRETELVTFLVKLIDSTGPDLQLTVAKLLSILSSNLQFQGELIKAGGIPPLILLLKSDMVSTVRSPISCLYNFAADPKNTALFAKPGIIKRLVDLQTCFKDEEIHDCATRMLQGLAKDKANHKMIVDAGVAERFYSSVSTVSKDNQEQMTMLIDQLGSALNTKSKADRLKLVDALISLTKSSSEKLQMQALWAMTNMASILASHSNFQMAWHGLDHNLQELLCGTLQSADALILSRGLLAYLSLWEKGGDQMMDLLVLSDALKPGNRLVMFLAIGMIPAPEGSKGEMVQLMAIKVWYLMLQHERTAPIFK